MTLKPPDDTPNDLSTFTEGIYVTNPVWASSRTFRDTNKDGLFYIQNFTDNSGTAAPTYTKGYGQWGTKGTSAAHGHGNLDAFWASYSHYGDGEVGLFIGDVTAKAGGSAGNIWGGHFQLNADIAANMRGLHIEMIPTVSVATKATIGLEVTSVDAFQCNNGVRVAGNFDRPIIVYSDRAGTTINYDVDSSGNVRARGNITPLVDGSKTLGTGSQRWNLTYCNDYRLGDGNTFLWASTGDITVRNVEVRAAGSTPFIDFSNDAVIDFDARLLLSGDDVLELQGADLKMATAAMYLQWGSASNIQTTVGAAGGASALPATPTKYLKVKDSGGTVLVIPAYTP